MPVVTDAQPQLERLDEQIINLLASRRSICSDLREISTLDFELLDHWLDKAAELELDEVTMEKICKLVLLLSRKGEE